MYLKKKFLSLFIMLIIVSSLISEQCIHFEETIHDFGDIKEEDGTVDCEFYFINIGDEPVKLKNVKAS